MRKKENTNNSKREDISFFQRISPFNKSIMIQIIFLSISIISAFLALYYISYQESIDILIYEGILPSNLNWMLYFIGVSSLILIVILFMPLDDSFNLKRELLDRIPDLKEEIEAKFNEELFKDSINLIETYFDELDSNHIFKKNEELLRLYKQAQINKEFKNTLRKINELFLVNAWDEFNQEVHSALIILENNYENILESQKIKLEEFSKRSRF
ncbi:hypothetical protein DSAG12_01553 [Promethearchaeum syntrophicum]|uniref:Uncharacterized protein n=1 Tax=Promethearchaeum syntrophicum TaxID=2594042 RepID=A0A5B9DAU5_9ARCH|nr:hypothetical protein [Candidatus Prometheoarchaeum syntrophicum]QEE15726.1 hypothetical protein DSAG12_01553 [Candidatus Prometheoarchaeum syntrophicum]